ncbi:DNase I-like protein, partial [Rozella allomycis CSF55]
MNSLPARITPNTIDGAADQTTQYFVLNFTQQNKNNKIFIKQPNYIKSIAELCRPRKKGNINSTDCKSLIIEHQNVRGLGDNIYNYKSDQLKDYILNRRPDIFTLSDTGTHHRHLSKYFKYNLKPHGYTLFHDGNEKQHHGTAIIMDSRFTKYIQRYHCQPGRGIMLRLKLKDLDLLLISIYYPAYIIIVGDWNATNDPTMDRIQLSNMRNNRPESTILQYLRRKHFVDPFREQHPQQLAYTYNNTSRIDFFLVRLQRTTNVDNCTILAFPVESDHKAIQLKPMGIGPKLTNAGENERVSASHTLTNLLNILQLSYQIRILSISTFLIISTNSNIHPQTCQNRASDEPQLVKAKIRSYFKDEIFKARHQDLLTFDSLSDKWKPIYTPPPKTPTCLDALNRPFTLHEVIDCLANAPTHKAPGPSGITFEILNLLPCNVIEIITKCFNDIMRYGTIPHCLKNMHLVLIPKDKHWNGDVSRTRPIALLESMKKLLSLLITNRLNTYISTNNLLKGSNAGFNP